MSNRVSKATSRVHDFSPENRLSVVMGAPVTFVTGKGGVGKTTVASLLSSDALTHGERVLFISLYQDEHTNTLLGITQSDEEKDIFRSRTIGCDVAIITPSRALKNYLVSKHMGAIAHRLNKTGLLDMIANIVPGMRELLLIGDIRSKAESRSWDRIIVDSPSTGHARSLFNVYESTQAIASSGVIQQQSQAALNFLRDKNTVQIVVVTLNHVMPLSECREFVFELEDQLSMNIAAVVFNKSRLSDIKKSGRIDRSFVDIFVPLFSYETQEKESPSKKRRVFHRRPRVQTPLNLSREFSLPESCSTCIVLGAGGVGKTTMSASIALRYARNEKNVALLTIDPARRLGTALGLDNIYSLESNLDPHSLDVTDEEKSLLHIFQLDTLKEFDRLLHDTMDDVSYENLRNNTFVSAISKMGIVGEFMAIEAMHRLVSSEKYDLVVIDTPPSHHMFDLLDTPHALMRMSQSQIFKTLVGASTLASITSNMALHTIMRPLKGLVGTDLIIDAVAFLRSIKDVEEVFIDHSHQIVNKLQESTTQYYSVCNPSASSTAQVYELVKGIYEHENRVCDVLVNGVSNPSDIESASTLALRLERFNSSVSIFDELELDDPVRIVEELSSIMR